MNVPITGLSFSEFIVTKNTFKDSIFKILPADQDSDEDIAIMVCTNNFTKTVVHAHMSVNSERFFSCPIYPGNSIAVRYNSANSSITRQGQMYLENFEIVRLFEAHFRYYQAGVTSQILSPDDVATVYIPNTQTTLGNVRAVYYLDASFNPCQVQEANVPREPIGWLEMSSFYLAYSIESKAKEFYQKCRDIYKSNANIDPMFRWMAKNILDGHKKKAITPADVENLIMWHYQPECYNGMLEYQIKFNLESKNLQ